MSSPSSSSLLRFQQTVLLACSFCLIKNLSGESAATHDNSWERPRDISAFEALLHHSPFSLPTAEESSPLAERYALTGIVTINGEEEIFVFDRTDQSREMLTRTPNPKNMALIALVREGSTPPQKATIRVGAETGTIGYLEATPQTAAAAEGFTVGGKTGTARPNLPPLPQLPGNSSAAPQPHRIIRRQIINAPSAPISPHP